MNQGVDRRRALRWILPSVLAIAALLAVGAFWGWNHLNRPPSIVGGWLSDDLRTEADDASPVTFQSTGVFDGDPAFSNRWRYADGLIYIRYWRNDSDSAIGRALMDTTLYAWLIEADEFPLVPTFNEDRSIMTLAVPGEPPHVMLRRPGAPIPVDGRTLR